MSSNATEAMPRLNRLRDAWARGETTFGAFVTDASVATVQVMARSGLDWIIIDMEHGAIGPHEAHRLIAATAGSPLVPFVRVPFREPWQAKAPLDFGALGVNFPMTSTAADARAAGRAVRYPPRGERYWGPFYAPLRWNLPMRDYMARADEDVLAIGTVEHIDALEHVDELARSEDVDLLFIGPGDLATSMGHRGDREHPEVRAAIARLEAGLAGGKPVLGGVATTAEAANAMVARGYRALVIGFDWGLLQRGIAAVLDGVRR